MDKLSKICADFRQYPFLERLLTVSVSAVPLIVVLRSGRHLTVTEWVIFSTIPISGFFKIGSKTYWFLAVLVMSGLLIEFFPKLSMFPFR